MVERAGRSLLVTGPGGSRKSTLLVKLGLQLCDHALDVDDAQVPVVLNLSSFSASYETAATAWEGTVSTLNSVHMPTIV